MKTRHTLRHVAATTVSALLTALILTSCGGEKPETLLASGKEFMAKNDPKAAIIQIKNALQQNANLPEARFLLGKALLDSGNPTGAEVELRKALDLKYPPDQVIPVLARAMLEMGQAKKVMEDLSPTQVTSPESKADLLTTQALAQAALGNKDATRATLDTALAAKPDFAPAIIAQAQLKVVENDLPGALALAESAIAKDANNHDAWKLKGDLMLARKETEPALAAYRKALDIRPDLTNTHTAIITVLMREAKPDEAAKQLEAMKKAAPKHPQTLYMDTLLSYQKKNFAEAREKIQQLVKIAPNNPQTLELAGEIEFQLKSFAQAEANLSKAVQLAPDLLRARRFLSLTYLRMNDARKALATLQPVLDKIANSPDMLGLAGEVYLQNGDNQKAEEYFKKALALDPKDVVKRTSLALTHLRKGNGGGADAAFSELEQIAATDSGTTADLALISTLLGRNEVDKALKAIAALEKKLPDNPLPHYMRGRALLAKKDVASARNSFDQALKINPAYFPAAASLAGLDLADKQPDSAKKRFETIVASDPKNVPALLALADLHARTGSPVADVAVLINKAITANPTDPGARLALINLHLANKDPKKAAAVAQDATAVIRDNPMLTDMLGRALQAADEPNQALAAYGKLVAMQPNSPLPHMRMAEIHMAGKNREAAEQSLRKALELKPDFVEAQRALAVTYLDARKPQEAIAVAREVQKQRPREGVGYMMEGDIAASKKDWASAASSYRSGLKQEPATELAIKLNAVLNAANNTGEAEKFAAGWIKEHPKDVAFRLALADLALARKEYATASQQYRNILEFEPKNALVLNNLAWSAARQKDAKALEYAEKANELAPNQPAFMDTLADLLAEKGDTARALTLQQKAVELSPQSAPLRFNLAKLLIKTGKKSEARKELETLAKLGTKFSGQAEVAQLLKNL